MKFGVNMYIWAAQFDEASFPLLNAIKENGFDGIEFPAIRPEALAAAKIRKALEDHALESTACGVIPNGLSLITEDAAVRAKSVLHVRNCIKAVAEAGATIYCGPIYSPVGYLPGRRRTEDEWKRGIDSFRQLQPTLAEYGVTLALEPLNRFESYFLNTAADAAALVAEAACPNVGVLYDTFHANIEDKDVAAGFRVLGPLLKHAHASENDRGTPGTGHVDWPGVFRSLRDINYAGWLTIESFGFAVGEISAAASIWRDLAPTVDEIAFEGLKFLKSQAARAAAA